VAHAWESTILANSDCSIEPVALRTVIAAQRGLIFLLLFFGSFVNILVLTGPIFALQVYDRVLGSRSQETLVSLTLLMAFLFVIMGILDHARKRIAAHMGDKITESIEGPVFKNLGNRNSAGSTPHTEPMNDIETLRRFFASPLLIALTDLIWIPLFAVALAVLHPALGLLAVIGGGMFLIPAISHLAITGASGPDDTPEHKQAATIVGNILFSAQLGLTVAPMSGMYSRWRSLRISARVTAMKSQEMRAVLSSSAQTFRIFLQSATIALGAFLVLRDQLTAGAIIASTVLLARALAPLDMVSQNTRNLAGVIAATRRISKILTHPIVFDPRDCHFEPGLSARQLTVFPPDRRRAALRMINFDLSPGAALGVRGPSGAGKSALVKTVVGLWPTSGGTLQVGQDHPNQESPTGYLPQYLQFLPGNIAQNIVGFRLDSGTDELIAAARASGAHEKIIALPNGYDTYIGPAETPFSGGLAQRICLARAVYSNPHVLVLDQPENHMDQDGIDMISELILSAKSANQCVLVSSRTPSILAICDQILVLDDGIEKYLGPPKERGIGPALASRKSQ